VSRSFDLRLQRTYYVLGFKFGESAYNKLLRHQGGGCAICGTKPTNIRLAVDHRHSDGLIRGLLCMRCNRGYGLFHDENWKRLREAAEYLEYPPACKIFGMLHTAPGRVGTKKRAKLLKKMKAQNV
jgi:hypothetical protein